MNKYIFTFGSGHHNTDGSNLSRHYVVIEAEDQMAARKVMFAQNGDKWASCYTEAQFAGHAEMYGYTEAALWNTESCCGVTQLEYNELLKRFNELLQHHEVE